MNNFDQKVLREAINGPNALNLKLLCRFLLLIWPFTIVTDEKAIHNGRDLLLWGFIKLFSLCLLGCTWVGMRKLRLEHGPSELLPAELALMSGLGGAIHGFVVAALVTIFHLSSGVPVLYRVIIGFLLALPWLPIIVLYNHSHYEYANFRRAYISKLQRIERLALLQSGLTDTIKESLNARLQEEVDRNKKIASQRLKRALEQSLPLTSVLEEIHDIADANIRGHAHELWALSIKSSNPKSLDSKKTGNNIIEMFRWTLDANPVNPLIYSVSALSLFAPIILRNHPNPLGFFLVFAFFLPILGIQSLGKYYASKTPSHGVSIAILTAVASALVPVVLLDEIGGYLSSHGFDSLNVKEYLLMILLLALFFILTFAKSTILTNEVRSKSLSDQVLKSEVMIDYIQVQLALISREWAHFVHGTLQSRLLAIAAMLDQAQKSGNLEMQTRAIVESQKLFADQSYAPITIVQDLREEVFSRIGLWDSLIPITLDFSIHQVVSEYVVKQCGATIEEAVSNAVRHGQANNVNILVHSVNHHLIEIVVEDDGIGKFTNSRCGDPV